MGYQRNPRIAGQQGEYYGARDPQDTDRGYGFDRGGPYSSAREYAAAGEYGRDDDHYGPREYGHSGYAERDQRYAGQSGGQSGYRQQPYGQQQRSYRRDHGFQGSYASDGHRFTETGQQRDYGRDRGENGQGYGRQGYGRQPQGYDYEERGFLNRAGDEVRSWFGDEQAERRRELDSRYDDRQGGNWTSPYARDDDYHSWRRGQIDALDRDYHEYRQENRSKFENEFGTWRNERQTQRSSLSKIAEHMDVVGSDGDHIGTVDKVRGDRIVLTKNDQDAGGRHHSIPSRWIDSVDDKVKVRKTAEEAKSHWRDEERNQAFFNEDRDSKTDDSKGPHVLNRSFSGTY